MNDPAKSRDPADIYYVGSRTWVGQQDGESSGQWQTQFQRMLGFESGAPLAGYFAYEFGFQFEPDRWGGLSCGGGRPMFRFVEMDAWYRADHGSCTAEIFAAPGITQDALLEFTRFIENAAAGRLKLVDSLLSLKESTGSADLDQIALYGELDRSDYVATVERILEDIRAGRYYELNFTQRFRRKSSVPPPVLFSRLVKKLQPSYAFYGKFDDEIIVSASPELFLHKLGNRIQTCPIKGSFRQPPSSAEMMKLHAEHTMVVDLARNDLGRISDQGWVHVAERETARQFGQITHLESRITGRSGRNFHEILAKTLPAASITGTPKIISVESISEYERSPRGIYTGNCGVLQPSGELQLNVAIRTLHAVLTTDDSRRAWQYTLGSGGAIVADSDPEQEYQECLMKVAPLLHELRE